MKYKEKRELTHNWKQFKNKVIRLDSSIFEKSIILKVVTISSYYIRFKKNFFESSEIFWSLDEFYHSTKRTADTDDRHEYLKYKYNENNFDRTAYECILRLNLADYITSNIREVSKTELNLLRII
jgi:hypothetical protein